MYCPSCNNPQFERLVGNKFCCKNCDFTYFHNVATAVAAIIRFENQILFTRRACEPAYGLLDLPGGFVDSGESLEQALSREVKEELSLEISDPQYLFSFPNQYQYKNVIYDTCDSFFEVKLETRPKLIREKSEILEVCWVALDKIDFKQIAFESAKRALSKYC